MQRACAAAHSEAAEVDEDEMPTATDGCGVVTFALTLERMAHAFARIETLPGGRRVADAMRAHPDLVGGPDGADFALMRTAPGWFAKGGAEGLLCAGGPDGIGVALKTEDGDARAHRPALAAFLGTARARCFRPSPKCRSSTRRGERVGELVVSNLVTHEGVLYESVTAH